MMTQTIQTQFNDRILTVTLNRPEVMNALNSQMRAEITATLTDLPEGARCVVLTGAGRAFCSGQDLNDMQAADDITGVLKREYEPMLRAITDCPVPVICALNGVAAGAGANLALVADVVIAAESAALVEAFSKIALIPDAGGTWFVPRLVGHARAMGMMLFSDAIPARKAEEWGLIYQVLPDADFVEGVAARARALANGPTGCYRAIRRAVRESWSNDLEAQLTLEAELQGQAGTSPDFVEGVSAFLQKRKPQFTGQ
ncbi:MAG: enoyl-CoA hydratase-related protein [Paracoccus sp. (in: a-proteobacteria)]|uniref:enoyl-CoA hydratase-related protein n=1 Tax=Paracoccus sp. TaxID=267 RepID=UPI0026DEC4F3|nr:enoyl-CoA hydratase-related protein [Paracoccus sp. (in: a-proteobacteria)]MDO5622067.1 enoyl-CoA hydratase-related protein [Paracoccus sp. (in: a-proteobacteria)]